MKKNNFAYIFGPVPSRRLGYSLGIDIIPHKICSFDCIYCQLGKTTQKTIIQEEYTPIELGLDELKRKIQEKQIIDYITLSGSGEPTLNSKIGVLIREIKKISDIPVAVLTNSSLFWNNPVIQDIQSADLILPSLDAGSNETFQKINRPDNKITFNQLIEGLINLRKSFTKNIWLEVLLVKGINDTSDELQNIADFCKMINPDRIQLNTITRPPCEADYQGLSISELTEAAGYFDSNKVEIIGEFTKNDNEVSRNKLKENDLINLLKRRPCTMDDIVNVLKIHRNEALKYLEMNVRKNEIVIERQNEKFYYLVK